VAARPRQQLPLEINGTEGDLVLTSPVGNLQVLAPRLEGGRRGSHDRAARVPARTIWRRWLRKARRPTSRAYTPPLPPIAAPARRRQRAGLRASLRAHHTLDFITTAAVSGIAQTSCDGDTDMRVMAVRRAGGPTCSNWWMY